MEAASIIVLLLISAVVGLLIWLEVYCRRNNAQRKSIDTAAPASDPAQQNISGSAGRSGRAA